jgi:hypothetical protein
MGKERFLIKRILMEEDFLMKRILENVRTVGAVRLVWKVTRVVIMMMMMIMIIMNIYVHHDIHTGED